MPGWSEILLEVQQTLLPNGAPDFDQLRRKYLAELAAYTERPTVLYSSSWLTAGGVDTSITLQDVQGFMEVFHGLRGAHLDLILHSPGGSPEAADRIVRYIRSRFNEVRVIVPFAAMSAATMMSLAADEIVMGDHSQLGPIDPQIPMGNTMVPAHALLRQFRRASDECAEDPRKLSAWMPTLQQYQPGLLEICSDYEELGRELVEQWLSRYMLKDRVDRDALAKASAGFFANGVEHHTHSRAIDREQVRRLGLTVVDLEADDQLQDLVLSVHHATTLMFQATSCVKIIENNVGRAFVTQRQVIAMPPQMSVQLG
ncbi:hypothetical protein ACFY2Z_24555 [Streptomyces sp. NPDC001222]|uniref:SDH family Clp fold serine proteinase n=1 Tax=Streptomyces sp. NPDC001222 TaxID=3364548 RepID=UPI00369D7210